MENNSLFKRIARAFRYDPDYHEELLDKLFIKRQDPRRLCNFYVLLILATVIATYGLHSGSSATVIGAMIVAPLMGPIMATTAGIVIASPVDAIRSLGLVAIGVVITVLLSWILSLIVPDVAISFTENPELASRISPGLLALLTALGSGAAGAYITSRKEIADSMGGVAIAISLVPPLCVVGIALSQGNLEAAAGSMLLFVTNFLAILLAGGVIFFLCGLGKHASASEQKSMRRRSFAAVVIATAFVAVPLTVTAYRVVHNSLENRAVRNAVLNWLQGTNHELISTNVGDLRTTVNVAGHGELPPLLELANELSATLQRPVDVNLRVVPSQNISSNR